MSDNENTSEEAAETPNAAKEAPAQDATDWVAEARKWEARSKENKTAADSLQKQLEAESSKVTALETSNTDLASKVETYESEKVQAALVSEVAGKANVPASALRGSTREELEAHADILKSLITKPSGPIIPGQERIPEKITDSDERSAVRSLFGSN